MRPVILVVLSVALGSTPTVAFGQSATATLTGTVKDSSAGVLPGVSVTARNLATNESRSTVTEADGLYRITSLPRGTYEVKAELQGFKSLTQSNVLLTVGDTVRLDFTLQVGGVAETVLVEGKSPLINVDEGRVSYLVDEKRVAELPLNGPAPRRTPATPSSAGRRAATRRSSTGRAIAPTIFSSTAPTTTTSSPPAGRP
jgi:Carboxypeptidase regulatory-like domain